MMVILSFCSYIKIQNQENYVTSCISTTMISILAGDYVKFNLPGAQALTTLAWGGISYAGGYKCAGEWENLLDAIKWGTDYFIKCHVSDNEYYAQV